MGFFWLSSEELRLDGIGFSGCCDIVLDLQEARLQVLLSGYSMLRLGSRSRTWLLFYSNYFFFDFVVDIILTINWVRKLVRLPHFLYFSDVPYHLILCENRLSQIRHFLNRIRLMRASKVWMWCSFPVVLNLPFFRLLALMVCILEFDHLSSWF